ncbi:MAG TPA: hypothetical protein VGB91_07390 [Rhizomicrobium sp.]
MSDFTMPLGGAVTQSILPWSWAFGGSNNQYGLFNIYLGQSSNPDVEREALDVASYGKQLGRIEEALLVLIDKAFPDPLPAGAQKDAIDDLKSMIHEINLVKKRHAAK